MRKVNRGNGYYGSTCVSRWTRLKLYSLRISLRLLISSKAISIASGMPAPHQDLFPVIGAMEPMYKGLSCIVMFFKPCAARNVNVIIHLVVRANSILQRECNSDAGHCEFNTSIYVSFQSFIPSLLISHESSIIAGGYKMFLPKTKLRK